ncbi:MAG: c-type cytochrome, partial [Steroidobacteraceae bacterium]
MRPDGRIATLLPALVTLLIIARVVVARDDVGDVHQGKVVYEQYCALCHGEQGDGKGHYSEDTTPVPRDFRQGTFKWRSTPSGSLPTDADLEKILVNGLFGTSMSSFSTSLTHPQRLDVIAYIKTFSARFATEKPEAPIT